MLASMQVNITNIICYVVRTEMQIFARFNITAKNDSALLNG